MPNPSTWQRLKDYFRSDATHAPGALVASKEWPIYEFAGWTLEQVQTALDDLGRGRLRSAEALLMAMDKDPIFAHGRRVRTAARVAVPHSLGWADMGIPEVHRRNLEQHLPSLWAGGGGPNAEATITKYRACLGPAPAAVTWGLSPDGLTWVPTLHSREAGHLTYYPTEGIYKFAGRDGLHDVIPDGKRWLLFCEMSAQYPHTEGLIRALAVAWWHKQVIWRLWHQYNRVHGNPQKRIRIPGKQRESLDAERLLKSARDLTGGDVVALPDYGGDGQRYDFDLMEAKAQTWETFPAAIDYADKWITLCWLGAWDNTQGDAAGSRARAQVHDQVSQRLTGSDCTTDAATLRVLWQQWCRYNRIPAHLAPSSVFSWRPEADALAKATARKTDAEAMAIELANAARLEQVGVGVDYVGLAAGRLPLTGEAPKRPVGAIS